MTEAELVALWEERAAIVLEGCSSQVDWKHRSQAWREREAERLGYFEIKRLAGVAKMPEATMGWRKVKVDNG